MEKLGLENGTLYGVLEDNGGIGNVTVNAITFNVTCGYVRNGHANDSTFNVGDLKIPTAIGKDPHIWMKSVGCYTHGVDYLKHLTQ